MTIVKRLLILAAVVLVPLVAASTWAVRQTKQVPDFYADATSPESRGIRFADRQMMAGMRQLQDDAGRIGSWKASFTDDQINAWLANELPLKFPRLLRRGASEPRVIIRDGKLLAAARYRSGRFDTVVSCELDVQLTEQPNMLALRIVNLRAGALPIPLSRFINGISREAAMGDVSVQWDRTENGPVALLRVPKEHERYVISPVIIEQIDLSSGSLCVAGHSGPLAKQAYQPNGPMHEFVSYRPKDRGQAATKTRWQ